MSRVLEPVIDADGDGPRGLRDRLAAARDRLLGDPRFQRIAARFPLTRGIARRRAREAFDLCAGFVYSQVLAATVRLGVLDLLRAGPQPLPALAARTGLAEPALLRLLDAATALRLVEPRSGGRYGLGALGAPLAGNPGITAMVAHHAALYEDLRDPVALLKGRAGQGALAAYWPYATAGAPAALAGQDVAAYTALMASSQSLIADLVLDAYPIARHRCLLDVGGGDGSFLAAAARRAPGLALRLFDLPAVAERARARFAAAGLAERAQAVGGDFQRDPLPTGADVVSLVRVVHDHDDAVVAPLFAAVRRALPRGGTLLIAEPLADTPGAEAMGAAYFGFYLLAMGSGRPRRTAELAGMLDAAGFDRVRAIPTALPLQTSLLVARAR